MITYLHSDHLYMRAHKVDTTAPHLTPGASATRIAVLAIMTEIVAMFTEQHAIIWHQVEYAAGDNKHDVRCALKQLVKAGFLMRDGQYYKSQVIHAQELREGMIEVRATFNEKGYHTGNRTLTKMIAEDVPEFKKAEAVS